MTAVIPSPKAASGVSDPCPDHDKKMYNNAGQPQYTPQQHQQQSQGQQFYSPVAFPPLHTRPQQYYAQQPQQQQQQSLSPLPPTPVSPVQPAPAGVKRKRKNNVSPPGGRASPTDVDGPSGSAAVGESPETSNSPGTSATAKDPNKRTKTQRACDPCRRKKIRSVQSSTFCLRRSFTLSPITDVMSLPTPPRLFAPTAVSTVLNALSSYPSQRPVSRNGRPKRRNLPSLLRKMTWVPRGPFPMVPTRTTLHILALTPLGLRSPDIPPMPPRVAQVLLSPQAAASLMPRFMVRLSGLAQWPSMLT